MNWLLGVLVVLPVLVFGGEVRVEEVPLGKLPEGWVDVGGARVNANWARDGKGFLRVVQKEEEPGFLLGPAGLWDGKVRIEFAKVEEEPVFAGVLLGFLDRDNFYAAKFFGNERLVIERTLEGKTEVLTEWVTRRRYEEGKVWALEFGMRRGMLTARVFDEKGVEQSRVDVLEEVPFALEPGNFGLCLTPYAGVRRVEWRGEEVPVTAAAVDEKRVEPRVVLPVKFDEVARLNSDFEKVAEKYDVVISGAGTAGWAAAVQAARMGVKVLLLEESDWIGGQMSAAAVTSMDEGGIWSKFPIRERGIYREFHESVTNAYYTANKDPYRAYYSWPRQEEGGYEPRMARAVLYGFIEDARKGGGVLDLVLEARVVEVKKEGNEVKGVVVERRGVKREIGCGVLMDATEYGDVLPLSGARYRLGLSKSDNLDMAGPVQWHTWLGVFREYPEGVPAHLKMPDEPPPGYAKNRYAKSQLYGKLIWGAPGRGYTGARSHRALFAWRGMANIDGEETGYASEARHTKCGFNGGRQDYPVNVGSVENLDKRLEAERDGVYRTLCEIYYFQKELGLSWALAEEEGYNSDYNREMMKRRNLRPDLYELACRLPVMPYVRESRRVIGLYTLKIADMARFENRREFRNSVAMGDYFMDANHGGDGHRFEKDLDPMDSFVKEGGPFQVPFEVFIPEKVDGFVLAEKNISQSRIVNGSTRLQPSTMLIGQAAGVIAARSVLDGVRAREVNPIRVQADLLRAGSNLAHRWYQDVEWGTRVWQATQLLSLHGVIDVKGDFCKVKDVGVGAGNFWRPNEAVEADVAKKAVKRLSEMAGKKVEVPVTKGMTRGEFALAAMEVLVREGKTELLKD